MKKITIVSLDKNLEPNYYLGDYGKKEIIFSYKDRWFYRITGFEFIPCPENCRCVYSTYKTHDNWAMSRDIKKLIDWLEEDEQDNREPPFTGEKKETVE